MFIGMLFIALRIDDAFSLKDRRRVVNSLKDKIKSRFNASVAEFAEDNTVYNTALIGVCVLSSSHRHADGQIQEIAAFVERQNGYVIDEISTEVAAI